MTTPTSTPRAFRLIPKADAALNQAAEITGHSPTDVVNRALQLYALLMNERAGGAELCLRRGDQDRDRADCVVNNLWRGCAKHPEEN